MEITRLSCVIEYSHSDIAFADNRRDLRKRHIEPSRLGKLWREETKLHFAGRAWLRMKMYSQNRSVRRMAFKIELQ